MLGRRVRHVQVQSHVGLDQVRGGPGSPAADLCLSALLWHVALSVLCCLRVVDATTCVRLQGTSGQLRLDSHGGTILWLFVCKFRALEALTIVSRVFGSAGDRSSSVDSGPSATTYKGLVNDLLLLLDWDRVATNFFCLPAGMLCWGHSAQTYRHLATSGVIHTIAIAYHASLHI